MRPLPEELVPEGWGIVSASLTKKGKRWHARVTVTDGVTTERRPHRSTYATTRPEAEAVVEGWMRAAPAPPAGAWWDLAPADEPLQPAERAGLDGAAEVASPAPRETRLEGLARMRSASARASARRAALPVPSLPPVAPTPTPVLEEAEGPRIRWRVARARRGRPCRAVAARLGSRELPPELPPEQVPTEPESEVLEPAPAPEIVRRVDPLHEAVEAFHAREHRTPTRSEQDYWSDVGRWPASEALLEDWQRRRRRPRGLHGPTLALLLCIQVVSVVASASGLQALVPLAPLLWSWSLAALLAVVAVGTQARWILPDAPQAARVAGAVAVVASIYTGWAAAYRFLGGVESDAAAAASHATAQHAQVVAACAAPLSGEAARQRADASALRRQAEEEETGGGATGQSGRGPEARRLYTAALRAEREAERLEARLASVEAHLTVAPGSGPQGAYEAAQALHSGLACEAAPPAPGDYVRALDSSGLLGPVRGLLGGSPLAVAAAGVMMLVEGFSALLLQGIRPPPGEGPELRRARARARRRRDQALAAELADRA